MARKRSLRKEYIKEYGKIPDGYELHHIIPVYDGGSDDFDNLIAVTKEDHKRMHLERYEKYGDFRDLTSYHMIGYNFTEAHRITSSEGGKIGGNVVKSKGIGIFRNDEERLEWASMGGKIGGKKQFDEKIGIHSQTHEERLLIASMGGKKGAFTQSEWQSEFGRRGGPKNKGFVWLNDGVKSIKYTKTQQLIMSVEKYLTDNPHIKKGRVNNQPIVKCPHCGREGKKPAMSQFHFENCVVVTGKKKTFKIKKTKCPHCNKEGAGGSMKRWHFENCKFKEK